ncbi:uncharacterized protein LOC136084861 [Hydra vulgaris]|uniref:Uncharacterized protein LOC136084861 n=1 Tax=Hydra vulgaris TaxID=6087 RepID=A0ABM4CK38_HYDVU
MKIYFSVFFFAMCQSAKAQVERCTLFKDKFDENRVLTQDWFKLSQLYSYCMYLKVENGQSSLSLFDEGCKTISCKECMKVCNLELPTNLTNCLLNCNVSKPCIFGCHFFFNIIDNSEENNQNKPEKSDSNDLILIQNQCLSVTFQWPNIILKDSLVQSLYLVTIKLMNNDSSTEYVLGLAIKNIFNIPDAFFCYNPHNFFAYDLGAEFKWNVYLINYNGYDESNKLSSSITKCSQFCVYKDTTKPPNSETQPVVIVSKDFIYYRQELTLIKGLYLGTLNIMMKEYTVSFNLKPKSYSKGLKNVLHFTFDNNIVKNGDRNPGVWFHENGSGKLAIFVVVNNIGNYSIETPPLTLNKWSFVKISQILSNGKFWLSVDLNGVNIHRVENYNVTNFKNVKVYASDPLCDSQNGSIADLLITNGKVEYIVGNTHTPLVKGKIIAEIPKLDKEYLISFDFYPNKFVPDYHSVIHFTNGTDISNNDGRTPDIWFNEDGKGALYVTVPMDGYQSNFFNTDPLKLNLWTNIEVSQFLQSAYYLYTIRINGDVVFSTINSQAQTFENVKVYASDPWYEAQDGFIKNFFIINGVSNSGVQPIVILPKDYINYRKEFTLAKGLYLGNLNVMMKEYTISFNLKPKSYSKGLANVLSFTLDNNIGKYGDRSSSVWFHEDGSGKLVIFVAVNNGNYSVETAPLAVDEWSFVMISQILSNGKYWLTVDLNGVNIHRVENYNVTNFTNVKVYASDPLCDSQNGSIADFLIINGKVEYIVGNTNTPLVKGNIIAEIPILDKEYLISFDFYPNKFVPDYHSVIYFTNGTDIFNNDGRTPDIWFNKDGKGALYVTVPMDGYQSNTFNTVQLKLNLWTNIEVSQFLQSAYYLYTIRINGDVIFSTINSQAQTFENVKVYASDPWYEAQDGFIKNFFIINGVLNSSLQPVITPSQPVITSSQPVIVSSAKSSIVVVAILVPVLIGFIMFSIIFMLKIHGKRVKSFQSMWKKENFMVCKELSADEWEIFPEDITLDRKIGEGAFGTVYIAKIDTNIFSNTKNQNFKTQKSINSKVTSLDIKEKSANFFAVKLLKDFANQSEVDDFNEEINLMKGIGYHKNIVSMIGCSTIKKPLCLVVEFMENGDLLHFLRNRRNKLCSSKFGDESTMSFMYTQGYQQTLETTISESCTSGILPHETPLDDNGAITPDDLLCFAWQIASGMEYLSFMKLVHRDLAARNILVGTEKNVKISDFGLTRKINDELNYMSSKNRRLPVKWMSVEAIFDQMFTTFSDVWAYGVVLFEIVTLGTPYPSISNRELLTLLKSGYRMERPENCSEPMYDIMIRCWNEDPLQRPTFTELRDLFDKIMSCGDCYFDFSIDEKNNYYNAASFNSLPSESGDDAFEENIFQKPVHVKSVKKISGETKEPLSERYTRDESSKLKIESTLSVGLVNCSANDMISEI